MHLFKKWLYVVITLMSMLLLCGCDKPPLTYVYLMSHPKILINHFDRCKTLESADFDCDMVRQAASDFAELVKARMLHPEAFGKKILLAEQQLAESKVTVEQMKGQGTKEITAKRAYQAQLEKVHTLLAVVSVTSFKM